MPAAKISPPPSIHPSLDVERRLSLRRSSSGSIGVSPARRHSIPGSASGGSVYERSVQALQQNEQWLKEIAMGTRVGFYRLKNEIGSGNFSQVKLASHQLTKERVAVKTLDKTKLDGKTQRMLAREVTVMEALHHPNIIRLFEVVETLTKVHLVLEYAPGGELFARITSDGKMAESEAKCIFAQLVSAVQYMHSKNIIHRDIKAENVFYSSTNEVKVGDFGFSVQVRDPGHLLNTFCGSPPYAAPELFRDEKYVGAPVDVWALGVLLYFMVTATMPFRAPTVISLKRLILDGEFPLPNYLSDSCTVLLKGSLQQSPRSRYSLQQVMDSDWLSGQNFPRSDSPPPRPPSSSSSSRSKSPSSPEKKLHSAGVSREVDKQTRAVLKRLGIGSALLRDAAIKGVNSPVLGTYRIVAHRVMRETRNESGKMSPINRTTGKQPKGEPKFRWNGWLTRKDDARENIRSRNSSSGVSKAFRFVVKPFNFLSGLKETEDSNPALTRTNSNQTPKSRFCAIL